jgi:FkbM family methyltransferase
MDLGSLKAWLKARLGSDRRASYSQFGEDSVLYAYFWGKQWRPNARTPRKLQRKGTYVDIGAYSPTEGSNTFVFYREGWRGINVDPSISTIRNFRLVRPRDLSVCAAVGTENGEIAFYSWGEPNVFNTTSPEIATKRENQLGRKPVCRIVPCMTLASILERNLSRDCPIDFLTVDVEGRDADVLRSNDWDRYRPELIVVEDYSRTIGELLGSPIHALLTSYEYEMFSWTNPSVIYRNGLFS